MPRRDDRNELEPPPAFRITARSTQLRRPQPCAIGDLDPHYAVPGPARDRDRLPRSTRAARELVDQGHTLAAERALTARLRARPAGEGARDG